MPVKTEVPCACGQTAVSLPTASGAVYIEPAKQARGLY